MSANPEPYGLVEFAVTGGKVYKIKGRNVKNTSATISDATQKVLQLAKQEADRCDHVTVGPLHILLGLVKARNEASQVLEAAGFGLKEIRDLIEAHPYQCGLMQSMLEEPADSPTIIDSSK